MTEKCKRTGCGGTIIDEVCEDCGRSPEGQSLVDRFASHLKDALLQAKPVIMFAATDEQELNPASSHEKEELEHSVNKHSARDRYGSQQHNALGAGLIRIEPLPKVDPLDLLLKDATVPENKRVCGHCSTQFHYVKGFCPGCGREYSLVPTLQPNDLVAEQYEIKGAIAFGGLGWIYLAWDKVLSRLVVLKGLLNSKDEISAAAALAERRYLAAVKHPNIVGIYNFVSHGREGFIVMEFVSGQTLSQMRQEHGPLPVAQAVAFIHRILSAFAYLHKMGVIYCDFKPDNCMFEEEDVKLIDMGAVRRVDEAGGDIFCTKGYAAPEASEQPSMSSDLYTIARSLAILVVNFKLSDFEFSLPDPKMEPLFAQHEALYRFLLKATRQNPEQRFESADFMACQLLGILAETVLDGHTRATIESTIFAGTDHHGRLDNEVCSLGLVPRAVAASKMLPPLLIDQKDKACEELALMLSTSDSAILRKMLDALSLRFPDSFEIILRLADLRAQLKSFSTAEKHLADAERLKANDWRTNWYRGKLFLCMDRVNAASACFDAVYAEIPGELAPKLALAICAELDSESTVAGPAQTSGLTRARKLYQIVARVDQSQVAAVFGLARCLLKEHNRAAAVDALSMIPPTSSAYMSAQGAIVRALLLKLNTLPSDKDLFQASTILQKLQLEGFEKHRLAADLLLMSLKVGEKRQFRTDNLVYGQHQLVLGIDVMRTDKLRLAAERELRQCARYAASNRERCGLVDEANKVRPVTFF